MCRTEPASQLLIVEDDKGIRKHLSDLLGQYELVFAENQSDAWSKLHRLEFDLVLLDLKLPRYDGDISADRQVGVDILRLIRRSCTLEATRRRPLPVIAMTAWGDEDVVAYMHSELGLSFYIRKPFGQDHDLETMIDRALRGEGAGFPPSTRVAVAIRPEVSRAQVGSYVCTEVEYALIERLAREWPREPGIEGKKFAASLGLSYENFRKQVQRLRKKIREHVRISGIPVDTQDILVSRSWHGFRLSEKNVEVVDFSRLEHTPED